MTNNPSSLPQAVLLIGPTGSGKTPLGQYLERHGLWGRGCRHFDFGEQLRRAAATDRHQRLTPNELDFIRKVLEQGHLLEDQHFGIARHIIEEFLDANQAAASPAPPWLLLNGLPRHIGQARSIDAMLKIVAVIHLLCPFEVVHHRIRTDAGGDRRGRADDHPDHVTRKHELFEARTRPLIDHYRSLGAAIRDIRVSARTTPDEVAAQLEGLPPA
jgi:adenylate kinase